MKVFVLNGFPMSGKDTFVNFLKTYAREGEIFAQRSTVETAKEALKILGWDGVAKTDEVRNALNDLKRISTKVFDDPFKKVERWIKMYSGIDKDVILFVDSREPEEIQRFVDVFGAQTILIDRGENICRANNPADTQVKQFSYDYIVLNVGTLEEFEVATLEFLTRVIRANKTT